MEEKTELEDAVGPWAARLVSFARWAGSVPGLDLASSALELQEAGGGMGLGLFAGRAVDPGQCILRLPFALCVTVDSVDADPVFTTRLGRGLAAAVDATRPSSRLRVLLYLVHARFDPRAPQHGFLQICPRHFEDPCWWSDAEVDEIRGTNLFEAVHREQRWLAKQYACHVRPLTEACPEEFPPAIFGPHALLWARSLWASRAFPRALAGFNSAEGWREARAASTLGPGGALIPVLDCCNHQHGAPTRFVVGPPGSGLELWVPADAPVGVPRGGQVCTNYGSKTDEEWLFGYGFVPRQPGGGSAPSYGRTRVELALVCLGPLGLLRGCARRMARFQVASTIKPQCEAASSICTPREATFRAGPFMLKFEDGQVTPPPALAVAIAKLAQRRCSRPHQKGASAATVARDLLAELLEARLESLPQALSRTVAQSSSGSDERCSSRIAEARSYVSGQADLLRAAVRYLRGLLECGASEMFGRDLEVNEDCDPVEPGMGVSHLHLVFQESAESCYGSDDGAAQLPEGASDSETTESDGEGESEEEEEEGHEEEDKEEDTELQGRANESQEDEDSDAGNGSAATACEPPAAGVEATSFKEYILFGDGCAIQVAVATA